MGQGAVGVLEGLRLSGHGKILHLRWTCVPWPTHPARGLGLRPTPESFTIGYEGPTYPLLIQRSSSDLASGPEAWS